MKIDKIVKKENYLGLGSAIEVIIDNIAMDIGIDLAIATELTQKKKIKKMNKQ